MGNNFIIFGNKRIKLSVIKKYESINSTTRIGIKIFYSVGTKPQFEDIILDDESSVNDALVRLDGEFGIA